MKKILISPNAFKGSLGAIEVAQTIKSTLSSLNLNLNLNIETAPIADGGDGTIDVINYYFKKSRFIDSEVQDPLGRKIKSKWLLLDSQTALIELAKASGLSLLRGHELNPMWANTFGTGELISSAIDKGCTKIIVTLGGSATVDGGAGILQALGVKFFDKKKQIVKAGGGYLNQIEKFDLSSTDKRLKKIRFDLLCDVRIPLIGEGGTVKKFSCQKGASVGEMVVLEEGMKHFAKVTKNLLGCDYELEQMVGSAGGVAYGLKSFLGAELFNGFVYLANMIGLEEKIKNSDLIITGEGSLDSQTLLGKGVFELTKLASKYKKNVIALCGIYDKNIDWTSHGLINVIQVKPDDLSLAESLKNTKNLIEKAIKSESTLFINC